MRRKIFLTMMLAGLVPLVVAAGAEYYVVEKAHHDDVAKLETAVLAETAVQVDNFMKTQVLAQARIITPNGAGATIATSAQEFALQQSFSSLMFLESEFFAGLDGMESAGVDRMHPTGVPSSTLADASASAAFIAAVAGNDYVGPVTYGASGPQVAFAVPVRGAGGAILGATLGTADLYALRDIISQAAIGSTGYLYLVDQSDKFMTGEGPFIAEAAGTDLSATPALGAAGNMQYRNAFGVPVAGSSLSFPDYGWTLVAEWPTAEADAVLNALLLQSAEGFGAVLVLIVFASFVLAAFIVRPIRKLEEATARVAQGNFTQGVAIKTGDELEALGNSFNDMVQGLKQLEQLKDEFVFVAAHELRTPVSAMKGYLELILSGATGGVNDETRNYIEKVIASDKRLVQLVSDLLEVARSQAGRLTIKVAPTDIVPAIRGPLEELKSLADEKSVKLAYEPQVDLPKVLADADRVKEVAVNLVGNAIKYMGGSGTVIISHELANGKLVTHVADTGLGISSAAQGKLFQKFYRVQTDKTKDIVGTGLGLFIVREIVEKMNGEIWVTSEEGKGSVFSFSLPVA